MNIYFKNDGVRPALLGAGVLALHLILLFWAAGVGLTSTVQPSVPEQSAPALMVRMVEPTPPTRPEQVTEPTTPPNKLTMTRKSIVARARSKSSPIATEETIGPASTPEPLASTGDAYETHDHGPASTNQADDGVDPKPASSALNAPTAPPELADASKARESDPSTEAVKSPDPAKPERTVEIDGRVPGASAGAFPYQMAPFPRPIRLTYAVHAPKDYRESSGSSGTAELRTELVSAPNRPDQFAIRVEINLSWLLRRMVGGSLNYESQGQIGAQGPQVGRYSEKIGERAPRWLEVDAQRNLMKSASVAGLGVSPTTQDRLSIIWLLGMIARADPAQLEKGKVFSIPMFTFRQTYSGRFESLGHEVLESPAGILQSLHVAYTTQDLGGDKVDIWLGYDYEMQPVRIRWEEAQGRVIDLILLKKPQ